MQVISHGLNALTRIMHFVNKAGAVCEAHNKIAATIQRREHEQRAFYFSEVVNIVAQGVFIGAEVVNGVTFVANEGLPAKSNKELVPASPSRIPQCIRRSMNKITSSDAYAKIKDFGTHQVATEVLAGATDIARTATDTEGRVEPFAIAMMQVVLQRGAMIANTIANASPDISCENRERLLTTSNVLSVGVEAIYKRKVLYELGNMVYREAPILAQHAARAIGDMLFRRRQEAAPPAADVAALQHHVVVHPERPLFVLIQMREDGLQQRGREEQRRMNYMLLLRAEEQRRMAFR